MQALTAAAAWRATRPVGATGGVAWEEWVRQHLDPETQLREQPALEGLNSLAADIPETWLAAARAVQERLQAGLGPAPPSESAAVRLIMHCLGWRIPGIQQPLALENLSVLVATIMQLEDVGVACSQLHTAYAAEARETRCSARLGLRGPGIQASSPCRRKLHRPSTSPLHPAATWQVLRQR